jgi:flagellar motor switch protein FliM
VEARLLACELDVATLQRVRIGDVVRLPHPLDRPLTVHGADDRSLFTGFLARSGGRKAIELASLAA